MAVHLASQVVNGNWQHGNVLSFLFIVEIVARQKLT